MSERGIRHIRTAFYNPQVNGGVERMNQTLKNGIRAHLAEGFQFSEALLQTLLHYRVTQHTTTDSLPALLMLGHELPLLLDHLRVPAHLTSQGVQQEAAGQLHDRVSARQQTTKQRFDRSHRAKHPDFPILDWVFSLRNKRLTPFTLCDHAPLLSPSNPDSCGSNRTVDEKYGARNHHFICYVLFFIGGVGEHSPPEPAGKEEEGTIKTIKLHILNSPNLTLI